MSSIEYPHFKSKGKQELPVFNKIGEGSEKVVYEIGDDVRAFVKNRRSRKIRNIDVKEWERPEYLTATQFIQNIASEIFPENFRSFEEASFYGPDEKYVAEIRTKKVPHSKGHAHFEHVENEGTQPRDDAGKNHEQKFQQSSKVAVLLSELDRVGIVMHDPNSWNFTFEGETPVFVDTLEPYRIKTQQNNLVIVPSLQLNKFNEYLNTINDESKRERLENYRDVYLDVLKNRANRKGIKE